jgi:hypothetical protein
MKDQIVTTQIECQNIADAIQAKILKDIANVHSNLLIKHLDKSEVDITDLTNSELVTDFVLYPFSKGVRVCDKGLTTAFAIPVERVTDNQCYIGHPKHIYPNVDWDVELSGLSYIVEEYSDNWNPEIEF